MRLKMKYEIVATDEIISNNTGLVLVNNIIETTNFKQNINDENLLKVLFKILLDESEEYSNDARYSAARMIPLFNSDILKKYKKELHHAQSYKINNLKLFPKDEPIWLSECKW